MCFGVVYEDVENSLQLRQMSRPEHLARLKYLQQQERLLVADPTNRTIPVNEPEDAAFTGSIIIAEFSSLEDALSWAKAGPYLANGVYNTVSVKPLKKVFP
jgi:uncharacterized protein